MIGSFCSLEGGNQGRKQEDQMDCHIDQAREKRERGGPTSKGGGGDGGKNADLRTARVGG